MEIGMSQWLWSTRERFLSRLTWLDERLKPFYIPAQQRSNGGLYAVDICARVGLFAQLNWMLLVFEHCERHALRPYVRLSSPYYCVAERGMNWLDYFFQLRRLGVDDRECLESGRCQISRISSIEQLGLPDYDRDMQLDRAHYLFHRYLAPDPALLAYVDGFVQRHFGAGPVIGLHYRGTDKTAEAPPVPPEAAIATVLDYASAHPEFRSVFVASDDAGFILKATNALKPLEVIVHDDVHRSSDGLAVHTRAQVGDPYLKAKEALVNCMFLSRCALLVRTASFLSGWASVFKPELPVVMLNRPYGEKTWFPDREVLRLWPVHSAADAFMT